MSKAPQKKLIEFDMVGFTKALRMEMQKATNQLKDKMVENARANLSVIPFKTNKVSLANGSTTSDAMRKVAVLNSIISNGFEWMGAKADIGAIAAALSTSKPFYQGYYSTQTQVKASVSALNGDFKDTHIGIYYEYGTGKNADAFGGPMHLAIPSWNPYRPVGMHQPIVSRSRKVNGGIWTDMGGNVRKTTALIGGRRSENFIKFVGEDLPAYHWFRRAFYEMREEVKETYMAALKKVNPFKYIKMPQQLVLGRRWE